MKQIQYRRKLKKAFAIQIGNIIRDLEDIHKELIVINKYCSICVDTGEISNIKPLLNNLEANLDTIIYRLYKITNKNSENIDEFLNNVISINPD